MNERIIPLKFNRKDFEEIYFRNNQANLFFSPATKSTTITFIVLSVLLLAFYFGNLFGLDNWGLFYLLSFFLIGCAINLFTSILAILKWKKSIYKYLKSIEKGKEIKFKISSEFINVIINENESFTKWSEFKRIEINEKFIALEGKTNYLFPKKSMDEEDYVFFKVSIKKILAK